MGLGFKEDELKEKNGLSAHVSLKDWLKLDCLSFLIFIPVIGSILYLVIYILLAFKSDVSTSIKTRIKANLIWSGVVLVIFAIVCVVCIAMSVSLIEAGYIPSGEIETPTTPFKVPDFSQLISNRA